MLSFRAVWVDLIGRQSGHRPGSPQHMCTHFRNHHTELVYFWVYLLIIMHFVCCCRECQTIVVFPFPLRLSTPPTQGHDRHRHRVGGSTGSTAHDITSRCCRTQSAPISDDPLAHETLNDDDGQGLASKSKPGGKSADYTTFILIFGALTRLIVSSHLDFQYAIV